MNTHHPDLFDAFVFDVHDALGSFEQATYHLREAYDPQTFKDLSVIAHRIKGAAALYNYPQVSRLAELVERLIEHGENIPAHHLPKLQNFLEQVAVCMRGSLEGITERGKEGPVGLQLVALGASQLFRELLRENPEIFVRHHQNLQPQLGLDTDLHTQLQQCYQANKDSWEFFAPEAREHLDTIDAILEENQTSPEHLHQLFRSTHTLKGAAYMLDFKVMGDLSHQLEDVMVMVREGRRSFDEDVKESLKQGSQVMRRMIAYAEGQAIHVSEPYAQVKMLVQTLLGMESDLVKTLRQFHQDNKEIWEYFKPEIQEQLASFEIAWNEIQGHEPTEERLNSLFRSMHTIKGAAYTVGLPSMGDIAKHAEHMARELREGELEFLDIKDVLKHSHDTLSQMLACAEGQTSHVDLALEQFKKALALVGATTEAQQSIKETTIRVSLNKIEGLMNLANEMVMTRSRLEQQLKRFQEMSQSLDVSRLKMLRTTQEFEDKYLNPRLREQFKEGLAPTKQESGLRTSLASTFNELELDNYNDLNIVARSISEMGSDLNEVQQQFDRFRRDFSHDLERVEGLSRNLRSEVSRTRLMPVSQLFQRLKRLVKEDPNKQYQLEIKGESVELDAAILEAINDAMIHLVKNAITHGIETREERRRSGKPPVGRISLNAYPQSNSVIIEVSDDGAGINVEAVKTQAVARGLRSAQDIATLDDQQAARLIFLAGLSTVKEVTIDAGRGVGMDAVMTQVKSLGGDISISTGLGQGTTFEIRVPLTLLVSEALMVKVAEETLAFPINTVKTLRYVPVQQLVGQQVTIGDQLLPLYHAHALLGLKNSNQAEKAVVVLETHKGNIAVVVDEFMHIEEISMRQLGTLLRGLHHLAGATFSSQGQIVLLLDPNGLIELSPYSAPVSVITTTPDTQSFKFLLVDDSISVRKIVGKMLERNGYNVVTAHDGQEALDMLRQHQFDAILTDLEMPRLNGYELIEDVRRTWSSEQLPIVVMTTRAGEKHRQLALELGANHYFSKPIDESKLLNFLRGLKTHSARLNS